VLMCH